MRVREQNIGSLVDKVNWLREIRIPNILRERQQVEWLTKTNIHLAKFLVEHHFGDMIIWKFEDECKYIHLELAKKDQDLNDAMYWKQKTREREKTRDEVFKEYKYLLPRSKQKELEAQE